MREIEAQRLASSLVHRVRLMNILSALLLLIWPIVFLLVGLGLGDPRLDTFTLCIGIGGLQGIPLVTLYCTVRSWRDVRILIQSGDFSDQGQLQRIWRMSYAGPALALLWFACFWVILPLLYGL